MKLAELCEPIFQYVCRLNRAGRKTARMDFAVARGEVTAIFEEMRAKAASDPRLNSQFKGVEMPLVFFVDSMISESGLSFASQWNSKRKAYEFNELAGDEKFFDLLEETMRDSSEDAAEKLAIFYTCMGLGFTGWYFGQPEYLRKKMLEIAPRIRHLIEADPTSKICPENYENVDTRDLIQPPSTYMVAIAMIFVVFLLTTVACNYYLFHKASSELTESLDAIIAQDKNLGQ